MTASRRLLAVLVAAAGLGWAPAPAEAVVGGTAVPQGKYPAVANVVISGTFGCTGTLIAPGWVLTAGHCGSLTGSTGVGTPAAYPPSAFDVTVGTVAADGSGGEKLRVAEVIIPPGYLAGSGDDTSLLRLTAPARTAPTRVAGVGFEALWKPNVLETIAGFGTTSSGGSAPAVEQEAQVPIVADAACAQVYSSFEAGTQLCAGYDEGGRDTCQGDSGGPLFAQAGDGRRYVVGATSYGNGCGDPGTPGVYARVADRTLREFIRSHAPDAVVDAAAGAVTTPAQVYDPATKRVSSGTPPSSATGPRPAVTAAPTETVAARNGFVVGLAADRTSRRTLRSRGLRVRLRCSAACSAVFSLRVDPTTARRLGLRSTTIATASLRRSSAGRSTVRVRLSRSVQSGLARLPRARVTLRATVRGHAARLTLARRVRLTK